MANKVPGGVLAQVLPESPPPSRRPSVEDTLLPARHSSEASSRRPSLDKPLPIRPAQRPKLGVNTKQLTPFRPPRSPSRPSLLPSPLPKNPTAAQLFELAVQTVGRGLALSLVYLIQVDLSDPTNPILSLESFFTPDSLPVSSLPRFDHDMHIKALVAKDGGLVYINPKKIRDENNPGYEAGLLVPCWKEVKRGMVIGGFTKDKERKSFTEGELKVFRDVGSTIGKFLSCSPNYVRTGVVV